MQPGLVQSGLLRADILQAKGDKAAALDQIISLARANPKRGGIQLKLGMLYQDEGRREEAEQAYRRAIQVAPKLALAYNNLAWMAVVSKNNLSQAEQWAKQALELAPQVPSYHDTLAWIYRAMGRLLEAEKVLSKAVRMKPQSAEIYYPRKSSWTGSEGVVVCRFA